MLGMTVHCDDCNSQLASIVGDTKEQLAQRLETATLCCHAMVPHCGHRLSQRPSEAMDGDVHVRIRCLHVQCNRLGADEWERWVRPEFVNSVVLAFHTSHEGHPIRVEIGDDVVIESPVEV